MPDLAPRLNAALAGRYVIEGEVGEGGMATVFLAEDLKHKRNVALKVLKPELSAVVGAERFLGEIETTASLRHPHILPLFDSGEADGLLFYVMPLVEGETLRERLEREGQLPVEEAVGIARAVANALDHAHRHGVVHRDVKPANILLQDGQPVVSDFGIALAVGAAGGGRLTETGLSVGTPYYMSPEQATGDQAVGPPSDIYALATVLYEMLVGEPPYLGNTAQAVLGKILQGDPVSATAVRKSIPSHVDAAIRKALERLPADRFAAADDFARALADPAFRHGSDSQAPAPPTTATAVAKWSGWGVAAVLAGMLVWTSTRPEPVATTPRWAIPTADGSVFSQSAVLLPDGSGLLYRNSPPGGDATLWIRRWEQMEGTLVPGTEGASLNLASVSPDGSRVAFSSGFPGPLRVAPILGGAVRTLVDVAYGGGVWGPDGRTLYHITGGGGLASIDVDGSPEPLQLLPDLLPDSIAAPHQVIRNGEVLLYRQALTSDFADSQLKALDLETGDITPLVPATSPVRVTEEGVLVYGVADGSLMVAPFDEAALAITGPPSITETDIALGSYASPLASVGGDGSLFFVPGESVTSGVPAWVDRRGRLQEIDVGGSVTVGGISSSVALSPDGDRLAISFSGRGTGYRLYIKALPDGPLTSVPPVGRTYDRRPTWSPDGRTLFFIANPGETASVWTVPADGSRAPELFLEHEAGIFEVSVTPDGEWLVYRIGTNTGGSTDNDIYGLRLGTDGEPVLLVDTDAFDRQPTVSPNGRWLAYESTQSGRSEIYVRPFPETANWREQISVAGGTEPIWSRDGLELFFRGPSRYLSVRVSGEGRIEVGAREELFPLGTYLTSVGHPMYDVHPDGERFVVIVRGAVTTLPAQLVRNWSQALARQLRN